MTQTDDHPVVHVSWNDAKAFCDWLSKKTGRTVRFPTEAEWEYACRAGSTGKWCFGDDERAVRDYAWYGADSGMQTRPAGQKKPNAWGLYDMHGNVWELVSDWYDEGYYARSPRENPTGPDTGNMRVRRGDSWTGGVPVPARPFATATCRRPVGLTSASVPPCRRRPEESDVMPSGDTYRFQTTRNRYMSPAPNAV